FASRAAPQERAHGDGIEIGPDSPEAFEEVIWRAFWPRRYEADRIRPWTARDAQAEATAFLDRHFRKIVALRGGGATRYVSKNNASIARLDLIPRMFPGATILVPLRNPLAQADSLRRQHLNFARRHAEDPFVRRYMRDIGHYEFGALHRPLAFEGFEALREGLAPEGLDYWLAYWIAAFDHVAARADSVRLIDYDSLHDPAGDSAAALCAALSLPASRAGDLAARFRAPPPLSETLRRHPGPLRERAEALHRRLLALAADQSAGQLQSSTSKYSAG
ncbi:MAG: sulfotransferase, partial [Pseudomonadota bacterium]